MCHDHVKRTYVSTVSSIPILRHFDTPTFRHSEFCSTRTMPRGIHSVISVVLLLCMLLIKHHQHHHSFKLDLGQGTHWVQLRTILKYVSSCSTIELLILLNSVPFLVTYVETVVLLFNFGIQKCLNLLV